ncbi:MAG TPA: DUF362 domain-containing protein [Thermodesulfobacteriota bacterium]|nr:DUF362 domain-containing protein [Thermodesulfobacteriota bacterium]
MEMKFRPEEMVFHREEYQALNAARRSKDYPPLLKKNVVGKVEFRHRNPNPYLRSGKALVSFVLAGHDIKADVRKAVDLMGGLGKSINARDRILIKPNFNSDDPPPGSTAMDFLTAVIDILREHGCGAITVGEGSGRPWVPTAKVFRDSGLSARMAELKIPLVDFDQSQFIDVPIGGEFLDVIAYPKDLEKFDKVIYLPTMKSHYLAGFSMSLKLAVGLTHLADRVFLHGDNNQFVSQRAAEIAIPVKPDLIVMDGRISFVSGGPAIGLAVRPGVILASGDPVAIDVQGIRLLQNYAAVNHLGTEAWNLPQIRTAVKHGLGIHSDDQMVLVRS